MYEIPTALLVILIPTAYLTYRIWRSDKKKQGIAINVPIPEPALPHWKGVRISERSVYDSNDPHHIQCYCPATGQFLGKVKADGPVEIDAKIAAARAAQQPFANTNFSQRRKVLKTISKHLIEHQEEIARVMCRDTGKTMFDANIGEIFVTLEKINWINKNGEDILVPSKRPGPSNILLSYKNAEVRYQPLGVVAALVSWNYPLHNAMGPIVSALFTGNAIVVKCSENVAWSSQFVVQIAREALRVNGMSEDLVQLVSCWSNDADYLTSHPGISHITFIGSKPVAHKVLASASKQITPVVAELGGKDPFIVLDDTKDLEGVASVIMRGTFQGAGQNCVGIERVIATPVAYEKLVEILEKRVPQLRLGSSIDQQEDIDMGACISDCRFDYLTKLIDDAVQQGARLLAGGSQYIHPKYPQGHFFKPTLLVDANPEMEIAQKEVFAPILLMFKAANVQECIQLANGTEYGLGASVFGSDFKTLNYITNQLQCGMVAINDFATYHLCQLPFGGTKASGFGRFGGAEGLRGLCLEKSVCSDKFAFIKTTIPAALDYPIPDCRKAWDMVKAINELGYAWGWARVRGLRKLAGL